MDFYPEVDTLSAVVEFIGENICIYVYNPYICAKIVTLFKQNNKQTRHEIPKKKIRRWEFKFAKINQHTSTKFCQYIFFPSHGSTSYWNHLLGFYFWHFFLTNRLKPVTLLRVTFCTGLTRCRENVLWRIRGRKARVTWCDVIIPLEASSRIMLPLVTVVQETRFCVTVAK